MKIFVAGHNGMVGSAILRELKKNNEEAQIITATRSQLDLTNQYEVDKFIGKHDPDQVYLAAAKVGGINANDTFPADFIYQNLMIQNNVINSAYNNGVKKLLFLGSSCIYPRLSKQPIKEEYLLEGHLEPTNEPYAIAKIAGIKMCESFNRQYDLDYRSLMPTNLYGPNDNYHPTNSHVIPGLIRRFHIAKCNSHEEVLIWGSGKQMREFLHVDDLASAAIFIQNLDKISFENYTQPMLSHLNVGSGSEISIKELAILIRETVGYNGKILFDTSKPDGTPRKLMNSNRLNKMGWHHKIDLQDGLKNTYEWFKKNIGPNID